MNREKFRNLIKNKKFKRIIIRIAVLFVILLFCYYENKHLVISNYKYVSDKVPASFEGYKIVQISDLHNARFGWDNNRLLSKIKEQNPDIIVITGDLVDANFTKIDIALDFAEKAAELCPVYYVTGNHEYWLEQSEMTELMEGLKIRGINVLYNESIKLISGTSFINLIGIDDEFLPKNILKEIISDKDSELNIVLAHEPDYFSSYTNAGADLVLSGHAHGGQFRLPFIGGVVAPGQGLNPEYTEGVHESGNTTMIISRGLGNSIIPVRLFNDPEIVCIELESN